VHYLSVVPVHRAWWSELGNNQGTTTIYKNPGDNYCLKKNQDTTSVDMVVSRQDYQRPESHKGVGYTMAAYRCSIAHDDIPAAPEAAGLQEMS
jgi:hypothetical protein